MLIKFNRKGEGDMAFLLKLLSVTLAATFLLACESTGPIEVPESKVSYSQDEYRIGVSDELGISVWRNEDLSLTVPVRPDLRPG